MTGKWKVDFWKRGREPAEWGKGKESGRVRMEIGYLHIPIYQNELHYSTLLIHAKKIDLVKYIAQYIVEDHKEKNEKEKKRKEM